jgi:hypothetical protein
MQMSASDFSAGRFLELRASAYALIHLSSQLDCKRWPVNAVQKGSELGRTGENIFWTPKIPGYYKRNRHFQRIIETNF